MQNEFEAKCVVVTVEDARQRLERIGARCVQPERVLRRAVFDFPDDALDHRGAWVRVRDEGDKITMSYKQAPAGAKIADCLETELTIDSYDRGIAFCEDLGMIRKSYQETKRETWEANAVTFDIDTWPGVPTFIEVEAVTEDIVRRNVETLGFSWDSVFFGGVGVIYQHFLKLPEREVNRIPEITFANPPMRQS
ncbi:CYTH domain-containing protein [Candidatus Uhrbacteria bacterium]|nr:CYTH domain-containing protein [Candidatus Uhrbacteria bacterium]